jgi:soluble lytic murein transglycosylase-like protein
LLTLIAFTLFSLFSLSPIVDGYARFPVIREAIQWVHTVPTNWGLLVGDHAPAAQIDPTPQNDTEPLFLPASDYVAIARQAAASAGIPQDYFVRQINQESGFNPNARSSAGAVGIAQFEPSTAAGLGINPYDPIASLYGAARYMARLDNSYGGDYAKALAAYNAGPPAVTRAVNSGGANWLAYMPAETQHYVRAIMG